MGQNASKETKAPDGIATKHPAWDKFKDRAALYLKRVHFHFELERYLVQQFREDFVIEKYWMVYSTLPMVVPLPVYWLTYRIPYKAGRVFTAVYAGMATHCYFNVYRKTNKFYAWCREPTLAASYARHQYIQHFGEEDEMSREFREIEKRYLRRTGGVVRAKTEKELT